MLLRLAYLGVTNVFALLPVRNGDKDAEILALRHQLSVLQRQLGPDRARFTPGDRALLAALLRRLPRDALERLVGCQKSACPVSCGDDQRPP